MVTFGLGNVKFGLGYHDLKLLKLHGCEDVSDDGLVKIAETNHNMHRLDLLWLDRITSKSIISFAENCPAIVELLLNKCEYIDDKCMVRITEKLHKLQKFSLCSSISDKGMVKIEEVYPSLLDLDLWGNCTLSDVGIGRIARGCSNLLKLNLSSCGNIHDCSVIEIAQNCRK